MKNIHKIKENIYITSDEEIKIGDYVYDLDSKSIAKIDFIKNRGDGVLLAGTHTFNLDDHYTDLLSNFKKIILTTDPSLAPDVQKIDDEFLEWFVKNPSCERVDVEDVYKTFLEGDKRSVSNFRNKYKIIIPKEEQKQHLIDMMEVPMAQYPKDETKKLFTDYPITELGDEEFKESPIRECELLFYDDNKYCYVKVEGIEKEIKRCYIYSQRGRCGEVDCISVDEIKELLKEEPKQETLEEAANNYVNYCAANISEEEDLADADKRGFIYGAKWQQENSYSEEEVVLLLQKALTHKDDGETGSLVTAQGQIRTANFFSWFNKFKKK